MNILIFGAQGRGKSNFVKNLLKKYSGRENWIFDPNQEYKMRNMAKDISTRQEFLLMTPHAPKSRVNVVYEEASGFFSKNGGIPQNLVKHICRQFHTQNLNVFNYHGLTQFNTANLIYVHYIIIFRTQDDPDDVHRMFKSHKNILAAYDDVMKKTEGTFFDRRNKIYKDAYSKKFYHYHQIVQIN